MVFYSDFEKELERVGLPATASLQELIAHHRSSAGLAAVMKATMDPAFGFKEILLPIVAEAQYCGSCADAPPYCGDCNDEVDEILSRLQEKLRNLIFTTD